MMSTSSVIKNQLKWQSRRGMLELDLIFNSFLESQYETLSSLQKQSFKRLLDEVDPDIYAWLFCAAEVPVELQSGVKLITDWQKNGT